MTTYDKTPYFPQDPVDPKYFVGREELLANIKSAFSGSINGRATNMAIYGERGMGKTSLLMKIKSSAPEGCFCTYVALSEETNQAAFVEKLLQRADLDYRESLPLHRRIIQKAKEIPGQIESFSLFDITVSLRKNDMAPEIAFLEAIMKLKNKGFKAVYILLDEADLLTTETIALIRNAIQELRASYQFPIGIIVAGKQKLTNRLGGKWSPISRFFALAQYELKPLTKDEVYAALTSPHVSWARDAAGVVFEKSEGYPTVVQLYGAICYLNRQDGKVTSKIAAVATKEVKRELWTWFQNGWKGMPSDLETQCALIVAENKGKATFSEVKKLMKKNPGTNLKRAVEKHILSQDEKGVYTLPHPLIAEVFLEYASGKLL